MFSISGRAGSQLIRWENTVFDRFVIISESFRGDGLFHRSIRPSRTLHPTFNVSLIITLISYNNDAFVSCTFNTHTMITTHVSNIFIFLFQVGPLSLGLCSPVRPLDDTSIGLLLEFLTVGWRHLSPRGRYNRVGKSKESDGNRGEANEKPAAKSQALDVHVSTSARICKVQM